MGTRTQRSAPLAQCYDEAMTTPLQEMQPQARQLLDDLAPHMHAWAEDRAQLTHEGVNSGSINSLYPLTELADWLAGCKRVASHVSDATFEVHTLTPSYIAIDFLCRCFAPAQPGVRELQQRLANLSSLATSGPTQESRERRLELTVQILLAILSIQSIPSGVNELVRTRSDTFFNEVRTFITALRELPRKRAQHALESLNEYLLPEGNERLEALASGVSPQKVDLLYPFELEAYSPAVRAILRQQQELNYHGPDLGRGQFETSLLSLPSEAHGRAEKIVYYDSFFEDNAELSLLSVEMDESDAYTTNGAEIKNQWGYLLLFLHSVATMPEPLPAPATSTEIFFGKWLNDAEKVAQKMSARLRAQASLISA